MEAIPLCDNIEVYIYLCLDTAYWVPCSVQLRNTRYTLHNLKYMLLQHCKTHNDVFLLINSTKV